jgi:lipopolysaccharide transport system ATP-binding protein
VGTGKRERPEAFERMSDAIITVENLGKRYKIRHQSERQSYVALRDVVAQSMKAPFRFLRGTTRRGDNGKQGHGLVVPGLSSSNLRSEDFWALKDVSFEVRRGEVVGIIGRNGAGKSTLLKILSRITEPTKGRVRLRGRVASLLEVGTGFHPELTGRENIFLNGAILGMSKDEIKRKFDEIVAFAEIEKFLDTPVKRYSSGMYVRLAFAVAAHLEPEILIVDEVLAVGDAEFQKKCLGKMEQVSRTEGRTVLFVSHNLSAIRSLCTNAVCLTEGKVTSIGPIEGVIGQYLSSVSQATNALKKLWANTKDAPGDGTVALRSIGVKSNGEYRFDVDIDKPIEIEFEFWNKQPGQRLSYSIHVLDSSGGCLFSGVNWTSACVNPDPWYGEKYPMGLFKVQMIIPGLLLNEGLHMAKLFILRDMNTQQFPLKLDDALTFNVVDTGVMRREYKGSWIGAIRPRLDWQTIAIGEFS